VAVTCAISPRQERALLRRVNRLLRPPWWKRPTAVGIACFCLPSLLDIAIRLIAHV
jgi:hypothetical protein